MQTNFNKCCAITLDYEGGNDDDPRDPGGRTSRGITQREWNTYVRAHSTSGLPADVWKAPQAAVVDIYRTQYWNLVAGDQWPKGIDLCVYDAGVNSGLGKSLVWSRAALAQGTGTFVSLAAAASAARDKVAIIHRFQARRLAFLEALRTWAYFGKGWGRRVAGIEALAVKMSLEDQGRPPEVVATELSKKGQTAANASKTAGGGAVAAPSAAATHASTHAHNVDWTTWAVDATILIVTIAVVAYLLHKWYANQVRAAAFKQVSK
jgi:lysozyme family protein